MTIINDKSIWHTAYIALGSNIGEREWYLNTAIAEIDRLETCRVTRRSGILETKAYGYENQDDFLNMVIQVQTTLEPYPLLAALNRIELESGRKRLIHWGPRTLDLDILLYDELVMKDEKLTIPHYDMVNREFVLKPMAQIAANVTHPVEGITILELYQRLLEKEVTARYAYA